MLTTDRDQWDRLRPGEQGVLIVEGVCIHIPHHHDLTECEVAMPPEVVEAAKPCPTCGGPDAVCGICMGKRGVWRQEGPHDRWDGCAKCGETGRRYSYCPDCHNGHQRVEVAVPCPLCSTIGRHSQVRQARCERPIVVGTVAVINAAQYIGQFAVIVERLT